jgi:hypothetical protein
MCFNQLDLKMLLRSIQIESKRAVEVAGWEREKEAKNNERKFLFLLCCEFFAFVFILAMFHDIFHVFDTLLRRFPTTALIDELLTPPTLDFLARIIQRLIRFHKFSWNLVFKVNGSKKAIWMHARPVTAVILCS